MNRALSVINRWLSVRLIWGIIAANAVLWLAVALTRLPAETRDARVEREANILVDTILERMSK